MVPARFPILGNLIFVSTLLLTLLCSDNADATTCFPSLSASSSDNSTILDVGNLCSSGTISYQCIITILDPNILPEFSLQAIFLKDSLSILPLCRITYASMGVNSSGSQLVQQGTLDPCWSPGNFTGWEISFTSGELTSQSGILWNFTIGQTAPLQLNATTALDDLFAVNHTYPIDLSDIVVNHHSIELNLTLGGPSSAFLPQVVLSTTGCAAVSHYSSKFLFSNETSNQQRFVAISGLVPKKYYLTFTRDMRVAFPASGQLTLNVLATPNGAPLRPFYLQYWFIGSIAIALLVVVMLVVTRAAVAQPYLDNATLKI